MRDENDELQVQLENLKAELNTIGKRKHRRRHAHGKAEDDSVSERSKGRSHKSKDIPKVNKVGSYLSDYTKPMIIKRNEEGETTEEEDISDDIHLIDNVGDKGISINVSYLLYYPIIIIYRSFSPFFHCHRYRHYYHLSICLHIGFNSYLSSSP